METIEDYIVNELFKYGFPIKYYASNDISFGSQTSGQSSLITIHFNYTININEKLFKSIQNYTRNIFKVKHEGFQDYNPYHEPNVIDLACDYDNFDDPSILICLSDRIKRYINKRISKFGYKVEYSAIILNNDDFMDELENILEDIVDEIVNYEKEKGIKETINVFSFKPSVCDKFFDYILRRCDRNRELTSWN